MAFKRKRGLMSRVGLTKKWNARIRWGQAFKFATNAVRTKRSFIAAKRKQGFRRFARRTGLIAKVPRRFNYLAWAKKKRGQYNRLRSMHPYRFYK